MKWKNKVKAYWELEPFELFLKDPTQFIVFYFTGLFFFGLVVGLWTIDILLFLTFVWVIVEFTKQILG